MRRSTVSYTHTLDREAQERFVKELGSAVIDEIVKKIREGILPEYWDGVELRRYMADKFEHQTVTITNRSRRLNYNNELLIKNL